MGTYVFIYLFYFSFSLLSVYLFNFSHSLCFFDLVFLVLILLFDFVSPVVGAGVGMTHVMIWFLSCWVK